MEKKLLYSAFIWAFIGVASGLYYRELTKFSGFEFDAHQQLSTVHTHLIVLGFVIQLLIFAVAKVLQAGPAKSATLFYWFWNVGIVLTGGMMLLKGSLVVLGNSADSAAFAGIAGLGHISLTVGFIAAFLWLKDALKNQPAATVREPELERI